MSYTKDAQGNIVKAPFWKKKADVHQELPALPEPPLPPQDEVVTMLEAVLVNQKAIYDELKSIASDISIIKDDSVEEATDRFKALQEEVVGQIAELEKKKGVKK